MTKTAEKPAPKANAAFMKLVTPSTALAENVASKPIPRTEVTKKHRSGYPERRSESRKRERRREHGQG